MFQGKTGFVSLEVSPELAKDAQGTVEEARRLHAAIARKNAMIKVFQTRQPVMMAPKCKLSALKPYLEKGKQ